ncbi:MAG TPA: hypothetical protein VGO38_03005 [Acidimicrobiia bacterium]|jgi:hypothetical protein
MTAGNGFPSGMDRFAVDAGTAEGLVSGAVDVGDAPPEYRAVAAVLQALREPPESSELVGGPAVAERIAATVVTARTERAATRPRRFATRTRVAVASLVTLGLALSGSLATAGALPEPAQRVASAVLSKVGISVPSGDDEAVVHRYMPTTAVPKWTTVAPVQSNPAAVNPSAPPPVARDEDVTLPAGPAQERGRTAPARESSQPTPPAGGDGPSPPGTPPGKGNGNAYGTTKAGGSGNGNGNGNGNGTGNGNAYGKTQASGSASPDLALDASRAPATGSP